MHLQGNLQAVFDALYNMGVIDPVLRMDWRSAMRDRPRFEAQIALAVDIASQDHGDVEKLMNELGRFEEPVLTFLAMEVAREYADYHARKEMH